MPTDLQSILKDKITIHLQNLAEEVKNSSLLKDLHDNYNLDVNHTNSCNRFTQPISYLEEDLVGVLIDIKLFIEYFDQTKIQDDNVESPNLCHSTSTESTVFSNNAQASILQVKECVKLKLNNCYTTIHQLNLTLNGLRYEMAHYKAETEDLKKSISSLNERFINIQDIISNAGVDTNTQQLNLFVRNLKKEDLFLKHENENVLEVAIENFVLGNEEYNNVDFEQTIVSHSTVSEEQVISTELKQNDVHSPKQELENDKYSLKSADDNKLEFKQSTTLLKEQIFSNINKDIKNILDCLEATVDSWRGCSKTQPIVGTVQEFVNLFRHTIPYIDANVEDKIILVFSKFKRLFMLMEEENTSIMVKFDSCSTERSLLLMLLVSVKYEVRKCECANDLIRSDEEKLADDNKILSDKLKEIKSSALNEFEFYKKKLILSEIESSDLLCKLNKLENDLKDKCDDYSKLQKYVDSFSEEDLLKDIDYTLNALGEVFNCENASVKLKALVMKYQDSNVSSMGASIIANIHSVFVRGFENMEEKILSLNKEYCQLLSNIDSLKDNKSSLLKTINDLKKLRAKESGNAEQCTQNASDELEVLRNIMISEIVNLDTDESEEDLTNSTSEEIFNKLMQIIIKKEGEVSANQEKMFKCDTEELHENNQTLKNMLNSQKSWMEELENENERIAKELVKVKDVNNELLCEIKTASCSYKCAMDQVSILKSDCLKLTTDNDFLKTELYAMKELNHQEKARLTSCHASFTKELNAKVLQIGDLKFKYAHSSKKRCSEDQQTFPNLIETESDQENNSKLDRYVNDCPARFDVSNGSPNENNKTDKNFINNLDQERSSFKNVLNSINIESNEVTLTRGDGFNLLKEIVELVQDKLLLVQNHFTSKLLKLQDDLNVKTSELMNIKYVIDSIYKDALANNKRLIRCVADVQDGFALACGDLNPLANEIDLVKDDCLIVNDITSSLKQRIDEGQYLIDELSKQVTIIQNSIFQKDEQISNLSQTIEKQVILSDIRGRNINEMEKEELRLKEMLQNKEKQLKDQDRELSIMKSVFIKLDDGLIKEHSDLNKKVELVQRKFAAYDKLVDDCDFFSSQCKLMIHYIINLGTEFDHVNRLVKESNMLLNHIKKYAVFFKVKFSDLTIHETLDTVSQMFSEYLCLKENQAKHSKELKSNQDELLKTQEEIKSLHKINSNLTFEINSSQDAIRNLRSELRTLRIQDRNRSNGNHFNVKKERKDLGIQTEYSSYNQERLIAELKESLHKSNSRITSLEVQIQREDLPNLKRAKLCDISLTQAKDKIRTLQIALTDQKRYNQELIYQINMLKTCDKSTT